jgi:beta-N-acetylhexosaminidase
MKRPLVSVCLALLVPVLAAAGCAGATGASRPNTDTALTATTLAPMSASTTSSPAQVALDGMTLRQKAAQVLLLDFSGTALSQATSALLESGPPGGLRIRHDNVTGAEQLRSLTAALQDAAAATGSPVGLLLAVDQEGGTVQHVREGAPAVPSARTLGTASTPAEAAGLASGTAVALRNLGINMNLAPVADVVSDQESFLYDRTYGGDPALVSAFVAAVTEALEAQGLIAVAKHFPGHGSASGDTHNGAAISEASRAEYASIHLPPFRAAIAAGAEAVMMSHIVAASYDEDNAASLSTSVVGDLLRGELGFDGLIVADDLFMAAASGIAPKQRASGQQGAAGADSAVEGLIPVEAQVAAEARTAVAALNAGCELLILTENEINSMAVLDAIVAAVDDGSLSEARLDAAVLKVLDLKFRHGILAPKKPSSMTTTTSENE